MNNEQKKETRKLPGFYIALCCCVLVIGIAGYFTERSKDSADNAMINTADVTNVDTSEVFSGNDDVNDAETETKSENIVPESEIVTSDNSGSAAAHVAEIIPEPDSAAEDTAEVFEPETDGIIPEYALDNPDVEEVAVIVSAEDYPLNMPVNGAVLENFSNELIYNSALADWRTHNGIDIGAEIGGSVRAAADGTVEKINTGAFGDEIVLAHSDGLKTKYIGLSGTESLSEGDTVKSGDVIGIIGESMGETVTDSHLHFEVYSDGAPVDPMEYVAH